MSKVKGSRAERELFHLLWDTQEWAVVRSAGSGSTQKPSPDLIASNGTKTLALECKAIKDKKKYFNAEELNQLNEFATTFGAEPWLAVRFDNEGWFFVPLAEVPKSKGKHFVLTFDFAKKKGLAFKELIGEFKQERLV
ncbi:MAG: Holliday junction resolvase Hjc [archaeon]